MDYMFFLLLGLMAGLLLLRRGRRGGGAPPSAGASPLSPDAQEEQWRALFSYEGLSAADESEEALP